MNLSDGDRPHRLSGSSKDEMQVILCLFFFFVFTIQAWVLGGTSDHCGLVETFSVGFCSKSKGLAAICSENSAS